MATQLDQETKEKALHLFKGVIAHTLQYIEKSKEIQDFMLSLTQEQQTALLADEDTALCVFQLDSLAKKMGAQ